MICGCDGLAALPDIGSVQCAENFGQIQKIAFMMLTKADGSPNSFTSSNPIEELSSWTPFLQATDDTKIVVSPYLENPQHTGGDPITSGGGNDSLDGIERITGRQPTNLAAVFRGMPQDIIAPMKQIQCVPLVHNLGVFFINGQGWLEAIQDKNTQDTYYPIPVRSLFVSDKLHGGQEDYDSNNIQMALPPNYSDLLKIIRPKFNAKIQLHK